MPQSINDYVAKVLQSSLGASRSSPLTLLRDARCLHVTLDVVRAVCMPEGNSVMREGDFTQLKRLQETSNNALREKGERSLHIVLGRFEMPWPSDPTKTTLAPIYLLKSQLTKHARTFKLESIDGDGSWELNPVIKLLLKSNRMNVPPGNLPDYVEQNNLEAVLQQVAWLTGQCPRGIKVDSRPMLANISGTDIRISRQLELDEFAAALSNNEVIVAKTNGATISAIEASTGDVGIEDLGVVLPCDDSQLRVIQLSDKSLSLQVEGPPGTGKSQTIANIIANLILKGKRVLFVCDKAVAVKQVKERLETAGLGKALLFLHDEDSKRKEFVDQVNSLSGNIAPADEAAIANLKSLREFLNKLWRTAKGNLHPSGAEVTKREGLGALIRIKRELGDDLVQLEIPGHSTVNFARLQALKGTVEEWSLMAAEIGDSAHPWNAVRGELYEQTPAADSMLRSALSRAREANRQLPNLRERLLRLGIVDSPDDLSGLKKLKNIARLVGSQPPEAQSLLAKSEVSESRLSALFGQWNERNDLNAAGHPIELASSDSKALRAEFDGLKGEIPALGSNCTWADLAVWDSQAEEDIGLLVRTVDSLRSLSTFTGCAQASTIDQANGACLRYMALRSPQLLVPAGWWMPSSNPIDILARFRARSMELSGAWQRSPWRHGQAHMQVHPIDLRRLLSMTDEELAPIVDCVEKVDEFLGRFFRPSRKGKNVLRNLYGAGIPAKISTTDWEDLCHHTVELRKAVKELHGVMLEAPFLQSVVDQLLSQPDADSVKVLLSHDLLCRAQSLAQKVVELRDMKDVIASVETCTAYWSNPDEAADALVHDIKSAINSRLGVLTAQYGIKSLGALTEKIVAQRTSLDALLHRVRATSDRPEIELNATLEASKRHEDLTVALGVIARYASLSEAQSCWKLESVAQWREAISQAAWRDSFTQAIGAQWVEITPSLWRETDAMLDHLTVEFTAAYDGICQLFDLIDQTRETSFAKGMEIIGLLESGADRKGQWLRKNHWLRCIAAVPELAPLWEKFLARTLKPESAWRLFLFNFIHKCEAHAGTWGPDLEAKVREFKELDSKLTDISVTKVQRRIREFQKQAIDEYPEGKSNVARFAGQTRINRPVREILQMTQVMPYLTKAKPCWMMSPASLSAYLGVEGIANGFDNETTFDCVIFDEASQMRVMEAVYCMSYARQTIIVGDRKQLPPTNFFRGSAMDTDEDEEIVESVLEEFGGVFDRDPATATEVRLLSHYRSETPDLIAFNNSHFYDNSLEICPPRTISGQGLKLVHVPEGRFLERKNLAEAQKVAELIDEHAISRPNSSLGVVVMNYEQMELIESLRGKMSAAGRALFDNEEKFFLRNLETVQGDEADFIILALTYGKGERDTFSANVLGPILRNGGQRRLNVASSRSKMGMTVVTSLTYADLSSSSASSAGFNCFKDFLKHLENTREAGNFGINSIKFEPKDLPAHNLLACDSDFEVEVASFLHGKGIEVLPQYGAGRYRIDLVVRHGGKNILAIECDGALYHSTWTARTRDRARQKHLESKGWRFHRIWSRNWFHNRDEECRKLMSAITLAILEPVPGPTP